MRIQLVVGTGITTLVTLLGMSYASVRPRPVIGEVPGDPPAAPNRQNCQTVATDPTPPLNIRSSPVVAPDNIVGTINNGTVLAVTKLAVSAQRPGWLKVTAPIAGWVYQPLTVTSCRAADRNAPSPSKNLIQNRSAIAQQPSQTREPAWPIASLNVIDKAQERFQSGQLEAAQALLQTIPAADWSYPQAQATLQNMPTQWQQGQKTYQIAQQAIAQGRWQAVLTSAAQVPDIRYWRSKMAPIVKHAIYRQSQYQQSQYQQSQYQLSHQGVSR